MQYNAYAQLTAIQSEAAYCEVNCSYLLYCEAKLYHGLFGLTEVGCNACTLATTVLLNFLPFLAATIHAGVVQTLLDFYSTDNLSASANLKVI